MPPASYTPLISVIVPVYRAEAFLARCVDSLLAQTYTRLDIILVEDGSPDSCGALCDSYAAEESRIRVIHQANAGPSAARNRGIEAAEGDYLCFVDADDYVGQDYIRHFVGGLDDEVDMVFQGMCAINGDTICPKIPHAKRYRQGAVTEAIADINAFAMFGYVWNKLFRKSVITENGLRFRQDINLSEDRIFALEYLRYARQIQVVDAAAYFYTPYAEGLTMRRRSYTELKKAADANWEAAEVLLQLYPSARFQRDTKRMYVMAAMGYLMTLFEETSSDEETTEALAQFKAKAQTWLRLFRPVSTDQKILCLGLRLPIFLCIPMVRCYRYIKKKKHEIVA